MSGVEKIGDDTFNVSLKAKPKNNEANFELIDVLAEYFKCSRANIRIVAGAKSRNKIIELG